MIQTWGVIRALCYNQESEGYFLLEGTTKTYQAMY